MRHCAHDGGLTPADSGVGRGRTSSCLRARTFAPRRRPLRKTRMPRRFSWNGTLRRTEATKGQRRHAAGRVAIEALEGRTLLSADYKFAFGLAAQQDLIIGGTAVDAAGNTV